MQTRNWYHLTIKRKKNLYSSLSFLPSSRSVIKVSYCYVIFPPFSVIFMYIWASIGWHCTKTSVTTNLYDYGKEA